MAIENASINLSDLAMGASAQPAPGEGSLLTGPTSNLGTMGDEPASLPPAAMEQTAQPATQTPRAYSNNFKPRRQFSTADIEAQNKGQMEKMAGPATLDDFEQAWRDSRDMDKDQALARLRSTARRLPEDVRAQLPMEIGAPDANLVEQWAFLQGHPKTKDLLLRPEFYRMFGTKAKKIGTLEKLWTNLPPGALFLGAQRGHRNFRYGREAFYNLGGFSDPMFQADMAARAAQMAEDHAYLDALDFNSWGPLNLSRSFMINMGDTIGGMSSAALTPEALGAATIGAGIGAATGPGALATGASGLLTGVSGAQALSAGGANAWETYQAQAEGMKDEGLAIQTAILTAVPSFVLERMGLGFMVKGAGTALRQGTSRLVRSAMPKAADKIEAALVSKTYQGVMARMSANAAGHTIPEVLTEGLQEGPVEMGSQIWAASQYNARYGHRGYTMPVPTAGDVLDSAMAGAWQAFWGGAGVGLIGPSVEALRDAGDVSAYLKAEAEKIEAAKNISPEQQEMMVDQAATVAANRMHIKTIERANGELRQQVKAAADIIRQDPEMKAEPEVTRGILGSFGEKKAFANAEVLNSLHQSALEKSPAGLDTLQSAILDPLGVTEEQFAEALANGTDVELDLNGLPDIIDSPLLDKITEVLTVEPSQVTREMLESLDELPPVKILPTAAAEVRPEVRADAEKRLGLAGRTKAQARNEAEIFSRQSGVLARITGVDPNKLIENTEFAKAEARVVPPWMNQGQPLYQPSVDEVRTADAALAKDVEAWGKSVDGFLAGTISHRHQPVMLNQTPLVLQMLGAKNLPVVTSYGTLRKILVEKHQLPVDAVKQVPAAMADPVMVFKSATQGGDLVMMLGLKDQHGATIIVPISLEDRGPGGYAVNNVKSVYGQKSTETLRPNNHWFANQIHNGNLLYINNKKSREWQRSSGLQLPGVGALSRGKNKIYHYDDLVKLRETNPTMYQAAYHGSPHRFDEFSLEHMGTGEGNQAYGWGLYFAGDKGIVEYYRKTLAGREGIYLDGKNIDLGKLAVDDSFPETDFYAIQFLADNRTLDEYLEWMSNIGAAEEKPQLANDVKNKINEYKDRVEIKKTEGQLYEVDVPDDNVLLAWDKPLSQQGQKIKAALKKIEKALPENTMDDLGGDLSLLVSPENLGHEFYSTLSSLVGGDKAASLLLNDLGIKGLKYLDGNSRNAGEGTHNYVVFDDQAIDILKTYYQQNAKNNPRGWTDFLADGRYRVVFTEAADASTAVHEFQHVFIDMAQHVLSLPLDQIADLEARNQLEADVKTLEEWAGVKDGQWTVEAHEKVAEAFERYFMEGKAPTRGLRRIFSQMKKWLMELYKDVASMGEPLPNEVARVFDRQLATDEELMVESWRAEPMFDMAAMRADVDPALLAEYEAALEKARQAEYEEAVSRRNAEHEKMRRQWTKEGREQARTDERQVMLAEVKKGGGINRASLEAGGYDSTAVDQINKRLPGLITRDGQSGFDEWGGRYNFESGDDFIQQILNTPTLDEMTEAYVAEMEAQFEAYFEDDANLTDERLDAWELELKLWGRFMGEPGSKYQNASWRDIRRVIKERTGIRPMDEISDQSMADLKASLKAQQRAAKNAFDAGEKAGALAKRLEMAAMYKVKAERESNRNQAEAHWKRLAGQKMTGIYRPAGIRPDFHSQIINLLNAVGFTARQVTTEMNLADFVNKLEADGAPVAVADWIRNGAWPVWENGKRAGRPKTYRSFSYDQFLDLKFAIQNLEHLGRRQQKVSVDGRLVDEESAVTSLMEGISQYRDIKQPKSHGEILQDGQKTGALSGLLRSVGGYMSSLIKTETMARVLDGHQIDGIAQKLIYKPVNAAYQKAVALTDDLVKTKLKAVVDSTVGEKGILSWRSEKVPVPGVPWALTTEQRVLYALNTGNKQNRKALRNYRLGPENTPITDAQHQAVLDSLTQDQWKFVQALWDFMDNEMFPQLNALTLRTTGVPLRKVEASPVMTKYGQMRGGYFPLMFDSKMSERADRYRDQESMDALAKNQTLYGQARTKAKATVERVGTTYKDLVPKLSLDVLTRSINDNIHDLTHRQAVNDVWRVLRRPEVRQAIEGALGENYWTQMKRWLQEVAAPEQVGDQGGRNLLRKVRSNISIAAMGLKFSVMLCQVTGLTQSVHKLGTYWTAVGLKEYYGNPMRIKEITDRIYEKSPDLKNRNATSYDRDIHDVVAMRNPLAQTLKEKWVEKAFRPIGALDQAVANPVWLGAYLKATKEGKSEVDAVYYADAIVRTTQPTGVAKDMSRAQRGWGYGDAGKLLTMFSTFFNGTQNLIWEQFHETQSHYQKGEMAKGTYKAGRAMMLMAVMPALMEALIKEGWPEDEDDLIDIAKGVVSFTVGGMPVVKDAVSYWTGDSFRFRPAPIIDSVESILRAPGGVMDIAEGETAKGINRIVRGLGPITGAPSGQIGTVIKGIDDWDDNGDFEKIYRLFVRESPK